MSDIVKRLRELEEWIRNPTGEPFNMNTDLFDEAADEIESLRDRLEVDPSHPYDGIYSRDETIRGLEKQIESLRQKTQYWPDNAERDAVIRHQKEEIERLREWNAEIALNAREFAEALSEIAKYEIEEGCPCNACQHSAIARAALEHD